MLFDKPQWKLLPEDRGDVLYANIVRSKTAVLSAKGEEVRVVYTLPPASFFSVLRGLVDDPSELRHDPVQFYLDPWGLTHGVWVLGFILRGEMIDLWVERSLPEWAKK